MNANNAFATRVTRTLVSCLFLVAALAAEPANAGPIELPAGRLTLWTEYQCCEVTATYTAATETFAITTPWSGSFLSLFPDAAPAILILDQIGTLNLTAHIDHTGNVSGGTFSLVSQSVTLGIDTAQVLFSGTILGSIQREELGSLFENQLAATIEYFNPLLSALTSLPDFAVLSFAANGPCFCTVGTDWGVDATYHLIQPDIFAYAEVPVPSSFGLIAAGLLAIGLMRRRVTPATT